MSVARATRNALALATASFVMTACLGQASVAHPADPGKVAETHAAMAARAFPTWREVPAPRPAGDARCRPVVAKREAARKLVYLTNRAGGNRRLTIYGAAEVFPSAGDVVEMLQADNNARLRACTLAYYRRGYRAQTANVIVTGHYGIPAWLKPPAGSRATVFTINARIPGRVSRGFDRIVTTVYSFRDIHDLRVLYEFEVTALDRAVPRSVATKLMSIASNS